MKKLLILLLLGAMLVPSLTVTDCHAKESGKQAEATLTVSLNRATAEELQTVPGIGPSIAERIVSHRTEHGAFSSLDQLAEVKGIGQAKLAKLRGYLSVD